VELVITSSETFFYINLGIWILCQAKTCELLLFFQAQLKRLRKHLQKFIYPSLGNGKKLRIREKDCSFPPELTSYKEEKKYQNKYFKKNLKRTIYEFGWTPELARQCLV